jgi:hypothetical protein
MYFRVLLIGLLLAVFALYSSANTFGAGKTESQKEETQQKNTSVKDFGADASSPTPQNGSSVCTVGNCINSSKNSLDPIKLNMNFLIFAYAIIFFALAWIYLIRTNRECLRELIGGNSLQFCALFVVVLSITLFGVMGVLEARELTALLGGISGYILGKGSVSHCNCDTKKDSS